MKKHVSDRPYSKKVTEAAVFAIDMIKRKRMKGLKNDSVISVRLGWAKQTIHYWRIGERAITVDQIGKLMDEFDIDETWLMKQRGHVWGEGELIARMNAIEDRQDEMDLRVKTLEQKSGNKAVQKAVQKR